MWTGPGGTLPSKSDRSMWYMDWADRPGREPEFPESWNNWNLAAAGNGFCRRKHKIKLNDVDVELVVSALNEKFVNEITYKYTLLEGPKSDLDPDGFPGVEIVPESEAGPGYNLRPMSLLLDCPLSNLREIMEEEVPGPWTIKVFRPNPKRDGFRFHPYQVYDEILIRLKKEDEQTEVEAGEIDNVRTCRERVLEMLDKANMEISQTSVSYKRTRVYTSSCTWDVDLPKAEFAAFTKGSFISLTMGPWNKDSTRPELALQIRLLASAIAGTHLVEDVFCQPKRVTELLSHFFGLDPFKPYDEERSKEDIAWFYAQISKYHAEEELESPAFPIQHPDLKVDLRPYQKAGIHWMLFREGRLKNCAAQGSEKDVVQRFQEKLYVPVQLQADDGQFVTVYYNKYAGMVFTERPEMPDLPRNTGILADEMGLGKTIQSLALILLNPMPIEAHVEDDPNDEITDVRSVHIKYEPGLEDQDGSSIKITDVRSVRVQGEPGIEIQDPAKALPQTDLPSTHRGRSGKGRTPLVANTFDRSKSAKNVTEISCSKCSFTQPQVVGSQQASAPSGGVHICSNCYVNSDTLLEAKTTLIVVPATISVQWMDEISRHTSLSVYFYKGRSASNTTTFPTFLGLFDIVVTTFTILSQELNFVDIGKESKQNQYSFRSGKKVFPQSSPLPCIRWWRFMIDEAQEIPAMDSKMGQMTKTLRSVNRWCVTGTPMSKGVNDLFAPFCFMDVYPISIGRYWDWLVSQPYYNRDVSIFYELFGRLMWRTEKENVLEQLNVPAQTKSNVWLQFSMIEAHLYQRHVNSASLSIIERINSVIDNRRAKLGTKLGCLDQYTLQSLMREFVELRKACCHPQVLGKQATGSALTSYKLEGFTMDTVRTQLVKYGRDEGRIALRTVAINLNRIGNALVSVGDWKGAVQAWNKLEDLMRIYNPRFGSKPALLELDSAILKLLNLNQTSESRMGPILGAERAAELEMRRKQLEADYIKPQADLVTSAHEAATDKAAQLNSELAKVRLNNWWEKVIQAVGNTDELSSSVLTLMKNQSVAPKKAKKIVNLNIGAEWSVVLSSRQGLVSKLAQLPSPQYAECNACGNPKTRIYGKCDLCRFDMSVSDYLDHFYNPAAVRQLCSEQKENFNGVSAREELEEEVTEEEDNVLMRLEAVVQVLSDAANDVQVIPAGLVQEAAAHKALISSMKEEAQAMAQLNLALKAKAQAVRDWETKCEQGGTKGPDAGKTDRALANKVETFSGIVQTNEERLNRSMARILYLENSSAENSGECQSCNNGLGSEWSALLCGHPFCSDCVQNLAQDKLDFQCPICQMYMKLSDVHLVGHTIGAESLATSKAHSNCPGEILLPSRVQGSYSTKVDGIVETVLKIQEGNPEDKILIFSTWSNVLAIIGYALRQNGVSHIQAKGASRLLFGNAVQRFKDSETTVLLLLLAAGSKGLNLIEATHVILAEPVLNTASELQAVGRVHRMGQTKPTYVYRFYVKDTIEDHLQGILATEAMSGVSENEEGLLSVQDLMDLVAVQ